MDLVVQQSTFDGVACCCIWCAFVVKGALFVKLMTLPGTRLAAGYGTGIGVPRKSDLGGQHCS